MDSCRDCVQSGAVRPAFPGNMPGIDIDILASDAADPAGPQFKLSRRAGGGAQLKEPVMSSPSGRTLRRLIGSRR